MHSALFLHPGLSVTVCRAIKRESIPTLLSKGLVPPTDRIIIEIQNSAISAQDLPLSKGKIAFARRAIP
jgi:hypothetical protein